MRACVILVCSTVAFAAPSSRAEDFAATCSNVFENLPVMENPFSRFASSEVDRIVITTDKGRQPSVRLVVTNRLSVMALHSALAACKFKHDWITLAGLSLGEVEFYDRGTNQLARVEVNNADSEVIVLEARGGLPEWGVSHSREFVSTVLQLIKCGRALPWATAEFEKDLLGDPKRAQGRVLQK